MIRHLSRGRTRRYIVQHRTARLKYETATRARMTRERRRAERDRYQDQLKKWGFVNLDWSEL